MYSAAAANFLALSINLIYAVIALVIGVLALKFIDKLLFPEINFIEEVKKGNVAASILVATILLFVAIVLGMVLS